MEIEDLKRNSSKAGELLSVMSNPSRLLVMCYLSDGEKSVQQLQSHLEIRQSALSQHLAILRRGKLVSTRRQGQCVYYSLSSDDARTLLTTLCSIYCD